MFRVIPLATACLSSPAMEFTTAIIDWRNAPSSASGQWAVRVIRFLGRSAATSWVKDGKMVKGGVFGPDSQALEVGVVGQEKATAEDEDEAGWIVGAGIEV